MTTQTSDRPEGDTPTDAQIDEMRQAAYEESEKTLRFLTKWNSGLSLKEARKILRHNREHPIVQSFVTVLRTWREEAMEDVAEENQADAQLREHVGAVRALRMVEEGILTIQMEVEE